MLAGKLVSIIVTAIESSRWEITLPLQNLYIDQLTNPRLQTSSDEKLFVAGYSY